ncbi:MAG: DMT family transporter [Gammaproteobacteria bacterium]
MAVPVAFLGVVLIWSTTPLAIQWSSEGAGFLFGVTARMVLGLLICLLVLRLAGIPLSWGKAARTTYVAAGLGIYGAMTSVYWAAQFIPSGWISVIFGLSPLLTSLLGLLWFKQEALTIEGYVGLSIGVLGLAVMFGAGLSISVDTVYGVAAVLVSVLIHSASAVWVAHLNHRQPPLAVTAGGLSVAAPLFVIAWFAFDGQWPAELPDRTRYAILYLAIFGSVLGFFGYFYLLKHMAAVRVNLLTLITPVLALLLGHRLNAEPLGAQVLLGAAMIMAGLLFFQRGATRLDVSR